MQRLAAYPDLPCVTQTVTLDGAMYRLRVQWRERLRGWYLDLYTLDEVPLVLGRRMCPGWGPLLGVQPDGGPAGVLWVRGPDDYTRASLGATLSLLYIPASEWAETIAGATPDPSSAVSVAIV